MNRLLPALALTLSLVYLPALAQPSATDDGNLSSTDLDRVKVGQAAPDFTLEDSAGKNITLSDYRGKKNVVLVYYRGHW